MIPPATMVKLTVPPEVLNSLEWVMKDQGGPLFSGLVPYGVHVALSECSLECGLPLSILTRNGTGVYDDRKDTLIRTNLNGKKDELDAISAT
jgi:programmed cell death 6-interacting protein